jgi:DivIVA domain-containing protein
MSQVRPARSQGPWDRRNVSELSQANFRTTLRGFDRDEVRAILESVAADYRVLQLQNASLTRQLADLEAVLQTYHGEDGPANGTALARHVLQRANAEARTILMRAHAQAEEAMARVVARAREAERPMEQFEEDQRNFRALLAATVSELLAVLSMTRRVPPAASVAQGFSPVAQDSPEGLCHQDHRPLPTSVAQGFSPVTQHSPEGLCHQDDGPRPEAAPPPLALIPFAPLPHDVSRPRRTRSEPAHDAAADRDSIQLLLKNIDRALVEIPALPFK